MKTTLAYSRPRTLNTILRLVLASALVSLSACQTTENSTETGIDNQSETLVAQQPAELLEAQGDYRGAASLWLALANKTPDIQTPQRDLYLLRAFSALLQADDTEQARQVLNSVSLQTSPDWIISSAQLQLRLNNPTDTLNILFNLSDDRLDIRLLKKSLQLKANAYSRLGNYSEAAKQRVALDAILNDALSQDSNHTELWASLNKLSIAELSGAHAVTTPGHFRDWLELAILSKQAKKIGGTIQLDEWQRKHPLHPAVSRFIATLRNIEQSTTATPTQIALLLPLNGRIAEPARAVRDGFLAAYYQNNPNQTNTAIRLYDADENNIAAVYKQALTEGADFVVGPLTKEAAKQLSTQTEFTVPTLMLNANDENTIRHSRLYQFSLLPEDEARQVAERVWLEGHNKGIIIYPESSWGERVGKAFQQHWQSLGGELVDVQAYSLTGSDYAKPVREVLNINDSKKRFRKLRNVIGEKLEFEERRRQDVDFIFLAAFPDQARQIRPQLKFYDASTVPVYATSHVFAGTIDVQRDRDMNGIIFSDMPWTISPQQNAFKTSLAQLWQTRTEKFARFYAFGIDAYNVIPHLQRLQQYPFERYNGVTGSLRLDENLRVIRHLTWAKFQSGKPRLEPIVTETKPFLPHTEKPIESGFPKPGA